MINLLNFQRPQRYVGNEINIVKKEHSGKITFCLCYPDLYEIGMDNLGLRIIYGLLNSYSNIVCERAFLPGQDLLTHLRQKRKLLFSLETKTPLNKFDLIGFNFGYELNYLNFLEMLDLARIPLLRRKRKKTIIIGGGVANPEPLADFVDVFCLGEFEAVSENLVKILSKKKSKINRLKELSKVKGFYVPQFYQFTFSKNRYRLKKRASQAAFPLVRAKVADLDKSFFPLKWLIPHTKLIQDRVPIEIARGCPGGCHFCQARRIYAPYREKSVQQIVKTIKTIYKNTGYENFSLLALSVSNYSSIKDLLKEIIPFVRENRISLSLPSLKIGDPLVSIYEKLLPFQKTPLTIAVEAGSQKLRKTLNKNIQIESLFTCANKLYQLGLRTVKIYFMYGFAEEKEEDLRAIGNFINMFQKRSRFKMNISINLFIPKPCSNWEKSSLLQIEEAEARKKIILSSLPRNKRTKVNFSNLEKSLIETILSRADSTISSALLYLHKRKNKIDTDKLFSWPTWESAFAAKKINWKRYIQAKTENFPWFFIQN